MAKVKAVLFGAGVIGCRVAKFILEKEGIELVGAIDVAPDKVGKDLGDILGIGKRLGVVISNNADAVYRKTKPDITVHTTSSFLKQVYPQIAKSLQYGVDVVSTCEELSYPYFGDPALAKKLDALAKRKKATVLGTGVNPGFVMDTLPITLTGVCQKVEHITVMRQMNAATRRIPFQKKIGAGLTVEEFREKIDKKLITGHVGLEQSMSMIADALGWKLDKVEVGTVEPVIAKTPVQSDVIKVEPGRASGTRQTARGIMGGREVILFDFRAYIGAEEEFDSVTIDGVPPINEKISPCTHGDFATIAMVVNSIPKVINAPPGLMTMKDLPIPSAAVKNMAEYIKKKR